MGWVKYMRKILWTITSFLICNTVMAQVPEKAASSIMKAFQNGAAKISPALRVPVGKLRYVPPVKSSAPALPQELLRQKRASAVDATAVERNIAQQIVLQTKIDLPIVTIRKMVASGERAEGILRAIFAVTPQAERIALLQNEFLTLTAERRVPVSVEQAQSAVRHFRIDLMHKQEVLETLEKFSSVEALGQADKELLRQAAQALADIAGIGFYGSSKDVALILSVYEKASSTLLEPIFFTAAARALLSLQAYMPLEELLMKAPKTEAMLGVADFIRDEGLPIFVSQAVSSSVQADWSVLQKQFSQVSRLNAYHFDFSSQATRNWLQLRVYREVEASAASLEIAEQASLENAPRAPQHFTASEVEKTTVQEADVALEKGQAVSSQPGLSAEKLQKDPLYDPMLAAEGTFSTPRPLMQEEINPIEQSVSEKPYQPVVPVLSHMPRTGLVSNQYPSGLKDEDRIIRDWLEYFKNGYFRPRDQVETIEGMSAAKANNVMEYLYYMPLEEAEKVILNPIRETGRLPDFMYDARLIEGTKRLPAGYYKNKFNENVKRFVELAEEDGSIYTHNVELKDLAASMADYSFKQGFRYTNDPQMTAGLRRNWKELVDEIRRPGMKTDRSLINALWRKPVHIENGKTVSLKEYFTQTRPTAFFKEGRMPEFFLNSDKWVSWENERRNLAAAEYMDQNVQPRSTLLDRVQDWLVLGKKSKYLTLDQFGEVMVGQYKKTFGQAVRTNEQEYLEGISPALLEDITPSSTTVKINNFDKIGGVCQMSFSEGGYMGPVREGYDGTSTVSRFEVKRFFDVPVVTFDLATLSPEVLTLKSVPYLRDLKKPDLDKVRASTMVGDGLDPTRDLLGVRQAEAALPMVPHLKATVYPRARLEGYDKFKPEYLDGGGLAGYLTLFTPDFYPLKKIRRLRFDGWKPYWQIQYFVRKEVAALAGFIHRDRLTFSDQVKDRVVPDSSAPSKAADPEK